MKKSLFSFILLLALAAPVWALDAGITGDYVEVRTSDVFTGPCFANAEVNLVGKEAILAWRVQQGSWEGIRLDGLGVVAVVKAEATLGDPFATSDVARSVIVVDESATEEQKNALVSFARSMGGVLTSDIVAVKSAPVTMSLDNETATLKAGDVASIRTRGLSHHDKLCGNEEIYYPPLTEVASFSPAYTLEHKFLGTDLNTTWSSPGKRSAFVGTFSH